MECGQCWGETDISIIFLSSFSTEYKICVLFEASLGNSYAHENEAAGSAQGLVSSGLASPLSLSLSLYSVFFPLLPRDNSPPHKEPTQSDRHQDHDRSGYDQLLILLSTLQGRQTQVYSSAKPTGSPLPWLSRCGDIVGSVDAIVAKTLQCSNRAERRR